MKRAQELRFNLFLTIKVTIKNRLQLNDALYKMLNTEHVAVYLIFTLILIIALFNIIGSIIMMILDKKKNLKTLYNLGATVKELRRIFYYQGILMTVMGGRYRTRHWCGCHLAATKTCFSNDYTFLAISSRFTAEQYWNCIRNYFYFRSISLAHCVPTDR